jgi:hypothetical protein
MDLRPVLHGGGESVAKTFIPRSAVFTGLSDGNKKI